MRLAMNQPYDDRSRGMGQAEEFVPGVTDAQFIMPPSKVARPPAGGGVFDTIIGGMQSFIKQVTDPANVKTIVNRTMYGKSGTPAQTMYTQPILAPKAAFPTTWLLAGGGLLLVLMMKKRR